MAKTTGVLGTFDGKLGSAVFANRRGINYARAYQPKVANPKSARQERSRAKMALAVKTAKGLLDFIRDGFRLSFPTYEMQRAVGIMIPVENGIITFANDTLSINWLNLGKALSEDNMGSISREGSPSFAEESEVSLQVGIPESMFYDTDGSSIGCGVVCCVYCPTVGTSAIGRVVASAPVDGQSLVNVTVKVPAQWSGLDSEVFVFAKQIPAAYNGIASNNYPWKFPSRTSRCEYVGHGIIN